MNEWGGVFLAVIAAATLATAVAQIGLLILAGRLARRVERLVGRLEYEIVPVIGHVNAIARDAAKAASVASAQVERVDRMVVELLHRAEDAVVGIQRTVRGPLLREADAIMRALRASLKVFRDSRSTRSRTRGDDEDVLFI